MKKRLHVLVHGKVQGVNFRWVTYEKALQLDLVGWIKNTPDRKVEAIFEGEKEDLEEMLKFVKAGPPASRVRTVEEEFSKSLNEFRDFVIDY